ncbi:PH domain-containing protein [Candidatus Bathyarchaeota archaeon]|nr:PH domain-containing protein [Candidatus Bathyarchaeota archaeon]
MSDVEVKVIKPPIENIRSGKVFKPTRAFVHKMWVKYINVAVLIWCAVVLTFYFGSSMIHSVDPDEIPDLDGLYDKWLGPVMWWTLIANLVWLIPAVALTPLYVSTIMYSVIAKSGEAMPEIYVKKGLFTVTQNHVPFRTITNISSVAGVYDRFFGIGSVHIETAGFSGQDQRGPEETMEGIIFYEELRDYILQELRKLRGTYVTTTELNSDHEAAPSPDDVNREILETLREIREHLKREG